MKAKMLNRINAFIALLIGILGFNNCEKIETTPVGPGMYGTPEPVAEYGCPYVGLHVSGEVVREDDGTTPLKNIQIIVSRHGATLGTTYTYSDGTYEIGTPNGPIDSVDIVAKDTADVFEGDSVRVAAETTMFDSWREWMEGESVARYNFKLKKKIK